MAVDRSNLCIYSILIFITASALAIIITLTCVGYEPRFYRDKFYVHALNNSVNSTNLTSSISIEIDLKFKRVVAVVPIRYEDLYITLYSGFNRSFSLGRSVVLPGFYQGTKKTASRRVAVEPRGPPWEDAFRRISGGSTVGVVVELTTKYRLRECNCYGYCSYPKAKAVEVTADVAVDGFDVEVCRKPLRLHDIS